MPAGYLLSDLDCREYGRLKQFPWLGRYAPWGVSPVTFHEVQLFEESGRLKSRSSSFIEAAKADPRFVVDDVFVSVLAQKSLELGWTRDPFDRLLAAHGLARRAPLCTTDAVIQEHYALIAAELR